MASAASDPDSSETPKDESARKRVLFAACAATWYVLLGLSALHLALALGYAVDGSRILDELLTFRGLVIQADWILVVAQHRWLSEALIAGLVLLVLSLSSTWFLRRRLRLRIALAVIVFASLCGYFGTTRHSIHGPPAADVALCRHREGGYICLYRQWFTQ
jgi:hypothetical protein